MNRRALTLIEMLLALSLLSAIVMASAAWTQTAGHLSRTVEPARLRSASYAVLDLIHDDIASGDVPLTVNGQAPPARVEIDGGTLRVTTRIPGAGSVIHQYGFDRQTGKLELLERPSNPNAHERRRPLLTRVKSFECVLDKQKFSLTVKIETHHGFSVSRSYDLP